MPAKYYPVEFNPISGVLSYVNTNGRRLPIHAGNLPPPPDGNVYPLHMHEVAPGSPVTVGVGPDRIQLKLSGNPGSQDRGDNTFNVLMDGKLVAAEMVVSDWAGQDHGQVFTIQGAWGPLPHKVTLASALIGAGLENLWITAVTYGGIPLVYNGPSVDARGAKPQPNTESLWDNMGKTVEWSDTRIVVAPPVPAPALTIITGAAINGAPTPAGTLAELAAKTLAAGASSTLKLPAGTFVGTAAVGPITIEGAGIGLTTIDATGLALTMRKGVLVPTASGFLGRFLWITGAADPDGNGAAVRQAGDGISFTLEDCELTGNQNGILAFNGALVFRRCKIHGNGAGNAGGGATHEVYLSGDNPIAGDALFEDCDLACGTLATHALKSRFGRTRFIRGSLLGNADDGTNGGRVVDLPLGGLATFTGSKIARGDGAGNTEIIGFATENTNNASVGMLLTLDGVAIDSKGADGGKIVSRGAGNLMVTGGSTYVGQKPQLEQWASVEGEFRPA